MTVLGIDPGMKGAIAVLRTGATAVAYPFDPDVYKRVIHNAMVSSCGSIVACVEEVHAMPRQGVSSTFSFGKNFGFILGMLFAEGIQVVLVTPQKWKKHYNIGKDKAESIALAKKLYPDCNLLPTKRCHKDNDGMAEAILIGRYYRMINNIF